MTIHLSPKQNDLSFPRSRETTAFQLKARRANRLRHGTGHGARFTGGHKTFLLFDVFVYLLLNWIFLIAFDETIILTCKCFV